MKAIIFHGTDCSPDDYWYPWLKSKLEVAGYRVEVPSYPHINHEPIDKSLTLVLQNHQFDSETVLIGHSAGSPLILSILQAVDTPVAQAVLVAGYSMRLPDEEKDPVLQDSYDWAKIKANARDFVFINSVDDPWGCNAEQGRRLFDNLGGTQVIRDDGHFGSTKYQQPYREFPLLRALILARQSV